MTSHLMQKLKDKLIVIPPLPRELVAMNPFVQCTLTHSNVISTLLLMKQTGLVVRINPKHIYDIASTTTATKESNRISQGSLFIPVPNFGQIFVMKTVSDLSGDESVNNVRDQILNQVISIKQDLNNSGLDSVDLWDIYFIICLTHKNAKDSKHLEGLKASVSKIITDQHSFDQKLQIHLKYINIKNMFKEMKQVMKNGSKKQVSVASLAKYYFDKLNCECLYRPSKNKFKFTTQPSFDIEEIDTVLEIFNFFFPQRHQKLETIPSFNRMTDNMLFSYSTTGETGKFSDYAAYLGEVRLFSENFLDKLENTCGLFIKGFSNHHLSAIAEIENSKPANFEIDWLYLGKDEIVAIEVGLSENRSEAQKTPIKNKIFQCLKNIIPQMQLILFSLWHLYQKKTTLSSEEASFEESNFEDLLQKIFKLVIFLPNIETETLLNQILIIKKQVTEPTAGSSQPDEFVELLKQNHRQVTQCLSFLTSSDAYGRNYSWIQLEGNWDIKQTKLWLHVTRGNQTIDKLFERVAISDSAHHRESFVEYISACFCCASLTVLRVISKQTGRIEGTPLQIEELYSASLELFKKRTIYTRLKLPHYLNFILSPQQYRLLSDNSNEHLLITGQPGTGKTTLLVAKCELLGWQDEITAIFYFYTAKRKLFGEFLKQTIETSCSARSKRKISVQVVNDIFDVSKKCLKLSQVLILSPHKC